MTEMPSLPLTSTHYGTYRVEMRNGAPSALLPFEDDPDPSPIGPALIETRTGPMRIRQPAVRRGFLRALEDGGDRSGDRGGEARGREPFVELPWDEALDIVAAELDRVRREHGAEAIFAGSYGWASAGRFHHAQSQLKRFMALFGGATLSRDSYSYAAGEVLVPHVVGEMQSLLIETTAWAGIAERGALVVSFGGLSPGNAQVNSGGTGSHEQARDMRAAVAAGVRIVSVSPARSDTLEDLGAEWIPIRPGTDAAMMLAIAHVLETEGLADRAFLASHCTGYERFRPYLLGQSDGQPKDPRWAATITGVPAGTIAQLARRMAAGPTVVNASWSLTRAENGEQPVWMAIVLGAMLGRIGEVGAGFTLGLAAVNGVGKHRGHVPWAALPVPRNPVGRVIPVARISDMLLHPGATCRYAGRTITYPDIRLVYWAGGNPFHHHQDLGRLEAAFARPETVVVHEPFWTPTARRADIVLPVAVELERADIAASPRDGHMVLTERVAEPFAGARTDHAVFAALAERLAPAEGNDFVHAFTGGRTEEDWRRWLYDESRERAAARGIAMPDWEAFRETGIFRIAQPERPRAMLGAFRADPEAAPLATPTGRIEIFSQSIAAMDVPGCPGHPVWLPPTEWLGAVAAQEGAPGARGLPLHLVSHQPIRRLHSQLDPGAHSRAGKTGGREPCRMHPEDAAARGIAEGDTVRIRSARGACYSAALLDPGLLRGVVMMATGAWYDPDPQAAVPTCRHGNPNVLTQDRPTSEIAQGPAALSCLVEIERAETAPEPRPFEPPPVERR